MSYVITWNDRGEQRYHLSNEARGTPFRDQADEYTKEEAETLIQVNGWHKCTVEGM